MKTSAGDALQDREVLMILDTSAWAQLGAMGEVVKTTPAKKIILDHHVGEDDLGAIPFKNTSAEATGRLVAELAEHLDVPPDRARWPTPCLQPSRPTRVGIVFPRPPRAPTDWPPICWMRAPVLRKIYADLYEQETLGTLPSCAV